MKVAIGSKNPVKIAAVKEAFEKVWPEKEFEFLGVEVPSGVPDQPMSDEESIFGATNRAKRAIEQTGADFGVGLEGGLQQIGDKWFDCGWIVIIDSKNRVGTGSSARIETPPKTMEHIHKGMELGLVNDMVFKQKNTKHAGGHFGLMTNNAITRQSGYRDGIFMALSRFIQPQLFED